MTTLVARPTFYEGEILPASDLIDTVDYARDQMARHTRYAHSWGIVQGLQLKGTSTASSTGQTYTTVTLSPGLAIDGTGREIVVASSVTLDPTQFALTVTPQSDKTLHYPVFLSGLDQNAPPTAALTGACGSSQSTSIQENYNISFGAPGSDLALNQQQQPALTDAPADGAAQSWLILLGYVTWDVSTGLNQFTGMVPLSATTGTYAGVNAAKVTSPSGSLLLATGAVPSADGSPVLGLQLQGGASGQLVFGTLNSTGNVIPAVTFLASGNVTTTGQISGNTAQVQSGMAFDGMVLPLPVTVNPADVKSGKITLHMHVSLRMDKTQAPNAFYLPYECFVHTPTRRVHCRMQVWNLHHGPPMPLVLVPCHCDYTVIATS
jgi:hypothetical protein